jgi:hypothetical protein
VEGRERAAPVEVELLKPLKQFAVTFREEQLGIKVCRSIGAPVVVVSLSHPPTPLSPMTPRCKSNGSLTAL